MLFYSLILFLHVAGALGIGAALGIEWTALLRLRKASTSDTARQAMAFLFPLRYVGGTSLLLLLATGGYMSGMRWGMQPWIVTALGGMVAMGALGGAVAGKRYGAIGTALAGARDGFDESLRRRLLDQALLVSLHMRTGLAAGIVMLMTVRPGWLGAVSILVGAALLGLGRALWRRGSPQVPLPV